MKTRSKSHALWSVIAVGMLACSGLALASSDNYAEDFQGFTLGSSISNAPGWYAAESNSVIVATNYTAKYQGGDYPIDYDHTAFTQALWVENGVSNIVSTGDSSITNWVDAVIQPKFATDTPAIPDSPVAAVHFNTNGNLVVLHTASNDVNSLEWLVIPDVSVNEGDWIRVTIAANMKDGSFFDGDLTRFYQVYVNGSVVSHADAFSTPTRVAATNGTWFGSGASMDRTAPITNVTVLGTGYMDDLVMTNALTLTAATEWTITATAGANGSIAPSGTVSVVEGNAQAFTITPDSGYVVDDVVIVENGTTTTNTGITSYTFNNVSTNGSITASFVAETGPEPTYIETLSVSNDVWYGQQLVQAEVFGTATNAAGTNVLGAFTFNTPTMVPDVGTTNYDVTFTPEDTNSYLSATGSVAVTTLASEPAVTWPTANELTEGDTLDAAKWLVVGSATNAYNGSTVDGVFDFVMATTNVPPLGTNDYDVAFTPTDGASYLSVTAAVQVVVVAATGDEPSSGWFTATGKTSGDLNTDRGDGMTVGEAWLASVDPNDTNSMFRVTRVEQVSGTNYVEWVSVYVDTNLPPFGIWARTNLMATTYDLIDTYPRPTGAPSSTPVTNTWSEPARAYPIYYRVAATNAPSAP